MLEFDNDSDFLEWCQKHPESLVVNTRREPDVGYFVLHRANCSTLRNPSLRDGAYTRRDYRKLAAMTAAEFAPLMRRQGIPTYSKVCSICAPRV